MRCPDGSTIRRRFLKSGTKVSDLLNFYKVEKSDDADVNFMTTYPRKVISTPENLTKTLEEMGLGKREQFQVCK